MRTANRNLLSTKRLLISAVAGMLSASVTHAADSNWVGGTSTDWNNTSNWSLAPAGNNLFINTNTGNIATVTANQAFTGVDIMVGVGAGANGQVNHLAGNVTTGAVNWAFIGCNTGNGVYNLADTTGSGGSTTGFGQGSGSLAVAGNLYVGGRGWDTGGLGTVNMNTSGTLNAGFIALGEGQNGTGTGNFNLDNGTVNINGEFWVSGWSTGNMNQSGGTVNVGSWLPIGRTGTGIYNLTGGTVNAATGGGNVTIGSFGGANGTLNVSGGTFNTPRAIYVAEGGTGTVNVSGTALVTIGSTTEGLRLGANGGTGLVNLDGGTIETPIVTNGSGVGAFYFNSGTLKATASTANYMTGISAGAYVRDGGAKINSNGNNITIGQALQHSIIGGDAAIDGGLTKSGAGTLSLSGSNTYTGATAVNAGALNVSGSGDINSTSSITVNGSGARFANTSSVAVTPTVTVTSGGVDGTGTINTVNVASSAANFVANGSGSTGTLTIGDLNFSGAGNFNLNVASTSPVVATTNLATNGTGNILVNATNALWTQGTYNLISYSSLTGSGFAAFQKGTITGLSNRQSASLTNPAGFISLVIAGDNPRWSGALSNVWSTAVMSNPKNWALITSATPTDYIEGDIVLFDDNATTTTPTLSSANVSPTSVLFNNTSKNYTLSGAFGIAGTATVSKQGTGALTINNANTYSGGTTLNAGTLNINNANAIGTGSLTVASGTTIDNSSGGAVTLATVNAQAWNGDFTFGGTNALNTGTGAISRTTATTVTVNGAAPVTIGGNVGGGANGLTKAGPGTLVLAGTGNTYTGITNVNAGTLSVTGSLTTSPTTNFNGGGTLNVAGTVTTQANVYNGNVVVSGTLNTVGDFSVALQNNSVGDLQVQSGGTVNGDVILVGAGGSPSNLANGSATIASGGTINTTRWFIVGHAGAVGTTGTATLNGGTLNVRTSGTQGDMEVGTWDNIVATVNINSGSTVRMQNNSSIILGALFNSGVSEVNQNGGTVTFYSDSGTTVGGTGRLILGGTAGWGHASGTYNYNLNGGTLTVPSIAKTSGVTPNNNFNFNGGTLRAAGNSASFISDLAAANVRNGGAVIDTNGNNITIGQALVHSNIGGDNAIDGGLTKTGAGTLTLTTATGYTGATSVNAGKLVTNLAIQNGAALNITAGGAVEIPLNGAAAGVTSVGNLTVSGASSHIEVHDNDLVINYGAGPSSYNAVVNHVKSGLVLLGGAGTDGITSVEVDAQTVGGTVLAVVDDGDPNIGGGITSISGYTVPNPTQSVLVKYTWFGDANLDGIVDGSDYALTDTGFTSGGGLGGWVFGDYDYSGTVDGGDYALQDTGFIAQTGALPEPTTLGLLGLGAVGMLRRRRA